MSRMDSRIILGGQQPDVVNALARGHAAGREVRRSNVFREHGATAANGDQNALNALAEYDPRIGQQTQMNRLDMQATQQRMDALSAQERRAVQAHAAQMSAQERQAQVGRVQQSLMRGIQLYEAGDLQGMNMLLAGVGETPIRSLEEFPALAAKYQGLFDALTAVRDFNQGPEPSAAEAQISRLVETGVPREIAIGIQAGRFVTSRDPVTGEAQILDKASGQPINFAGNQQAAPQADTQTAQPPSVTNTPFSFGAIGAASSAANTVADVVGADVPFPEVQETQARFAVMRENLTRLISEGYQRQPPAFLMKGIQDLIPQAGKLTQGASGVQTDLQALLTNFDTEISAIEGQLSGRRMSPNAKIKLEGQLSALMQSRNLVRRELDGFEASPSGNTTTGGVQWEVIE